MVNTLGGKTDPQVPMAARVVEVMRRYPEAKVHLYGKDHRPGRKMGHINVSGTDVDTVLERARAAAAIIVEGA